MERLSVLFDGHCAVCRSTATWLADAQHAVPLELVDCQTSRAKERFGAIPWLGAELVVVADDGRVWAGPAAFLVCGWALARWRWLASLAMSRGLLPISLALFGWVTSHREALGYFVGAPECSDGHCLVKHAPAHAMLPAPYR